MSNRKLAEEIEALVADASAHLPTPLECVHVIDKTDTVDAVVGVGGEYVAYRIDPAVGFLFVALVNNLPAILSALRAEPDEAAVERVAKAIQRAAHIDIDVNNYGLSATAEISNPDEVARAAILAMQEPRDG